MPSQTCRHPSAMEQPPELIAVPRKRRNFGKGNFLEKKPE
jgi:hypothetical protein